MKKCCVEKENADTEIAERYPGSHCCPANGMSYVSVKRKTLLHHISQPWLSSLPEQGYFFALIPIAMLFILVRTIW
jgi:hypothetical protein